jgi:hypothetical protein
VVQCDLLPGGRIDGTNGGDRCQVIEYDFQRVDREFLCGANPSAGGDVRYITSSSLLNDFTPVATAALGSPSAISNGTFISDIEAGNVIVIAIHPYQAQVTSTGSGASTMTFTSVTGGHCLAVPGFISTSFKNPLGGTSVSQAIEVVDPQYGKELWINIFDLTNGTFTQGGQSVTVTLPLGLTSVGIWPDRTPPVNSVWDILHAQAAATQAGQVFQLTFIDTYLTLNVP